MNQHTIYIIGRLMDYGSKFATYHSQHSFESAKHVATIIMQCSY